MLPVSRLREPADVVRRARRRCIKETPTLWAPAPNIVRAAKTIPALPSTGKVWSSFEMRSKSTSLMVEKEGHACAADGKASEHGFPAEHETCEHIIRCITSDLHGTPRAARNNVSECASTAKTSASTWALARTWWSNPKPSRGNNTSFPRVAEAKSFIYAPSDQESVSTGKAYL